MHTLAKESVWGGRKPLAIIQACQPSQVKNLEILYLKSLKLQELQPEPSEEQKKKKKKSPPDT